MITAAIARIAFLDAVAKGENYDPADYNELVGGGRFDSFDHFPIWSGKTFSTGISHAAGRYQFQPRTWAECAGELGLKDFSPASQDAGAWYLAGRVYHRVTGRDLEADLVAGQLDQVAPALKSTWTSLSPTSFPGRFKAAVEQRTAGGVHVAAPVVPPIPAPRRATAPAAPMTTLAATGLGGWLAYFLMAYLRTRGWDTSDLGLQASSYGICSVGAAIVLHCFPWLSSAAGTDRPISSLGVSRTVKGAAAAALVLLLVGCAQLPVNPHQAGDDERVETKILRACTASGLFRPAIATGEALLEAAVPIATLPVAVVEAGVHLVCANPHGFGHEIATVEWVIKNLARHRPAT
jgi:muramidase (phage lysozyme)